MNVIDRETKAVKCNFTLKQAKELVELQKGIPILGLKNNLKEILYNYTGSLSAAIMKQAGISKTMACLRAEAYMRNRQFAACIYKMDEAAEKFGLMSAFKLREVLNDIAENAEKDTDRIAAVKLLMQDKDMIGASKPKTGGDNNIQIVFGTHPDDLRKQDQIIDITPKIGE